MNCQFCNSPESIEGHGTFNCGSYRSEHCGFRSVECQLGEKILNLTKERDDWKNIANKMFSAASDVHDVFESATGKCWLHCKHRNET